MRYVKVEFTCLECGFRALVDEAGFVAQENWIRCPRCETVVGTHARATSPVEDDLSRAADA